MIAQVSVIHTLEVDAANASRSKYTQAFHSETTILWIVIVLFFKKKNRPFQVAANQLIDISLSRKACCGEKFVKSWWRVSSSVKVKRIKGEMHNCFLW